MVRAHALQKLGLDPRTHIKATLPCDSWMETGALKSLAAQPVGLKSGKPQVSERLSQGN